MLKQSEAMELKLQGKKPSEDEDFDAIAKQLRRENNRLDSLLEGKESLFGKARKAAEIAIENMQGVIAEINRLEEKADRKSTRLNSSHYCASRMPSSA